MRYLTICLSFAVVIIGCASGTQNLRKIDPGMLPQQVEQIMGKRDGFSNIEKDGHKYTIYRYINRYCNANVDMRDKCDFYVIFKDNAVIETGTDDVRTRNSNMNILYLFGN